MIGDLTICPGCGDDLDEGLDSCWRCASAEAEADGWTEEDRASLRESEFIDKLNASIRSHSLGGDDHEAAPDANQAPSIEVKVASIEDFAAIDEPGADPLIGTPGNILIPEAGDVMLYGDGGAGKTTLAVDMGCHLGSGRDWLEMPVPRPVRCLLIENEGPRALLRQKLRRKLAAWDGPAIERRVSILSAPWATFTFAAEQWRAELARIVSKRQIDVIIAGPLTRIGMDGPGTLQEVAGFLALVQDVRARGERRLTLILVHHENKGGAVSGAWEGAGDTLLHVQAARPGQTVVHVQKARWASELHGKTLKLAWTAGEGFEPIGDRDLLSEVTELMADGEWRTVDEIRAGVGAGTQAVRKLLTDHEDHFELCTGEDARLLGRSPKAQLYRVAQ
jgi:hypothetical protein